MSQFSYPTNLFSHTFPMMKKHLLPALLALSIVTPVTAETFQANGTKELSIKANGDLINARRIAREQAEKDAVASVLKIKLSADMNDPKVRNALPDLHKQLADKLRTSFSAEGDVLSARSVLQVESSEFLDLARSLGIGSGVAVANARVLFLIDEYYGVGTRLDPSLPLVTEIDYSHDKSAMSDQSTSVASSRSASSSSTSAAKGSFAAASSDKAAFAASSASSVAARDRQAHSGSASGAIALRDGYGNAGAASGSASSSGARDTQFTSAQKSSAAGSASSQAAMSATYANASASKSASAAGYSAQNNDVRRQNDVVNLKVRQVFAGIDNGRPVEASSALITQKLQQVAGDFGLAFTDERDFRVEGGQRLTVSDIERLQKFDAYLAKAAAGSYRAKYVVYGRARMQTEGTSPSGQTECSGQLQLTSSNVDTGAGFVAGTIVKRATGSSDQNCRGNLSEAMARALADTIGTKAQRTLQQGAVQGTPYFVSIYSALRVPGKVRRDFSSRLKAIEGVVEIGDGDNATDELRTWNVMAKGNFSERMEDMVDAFKESGDAAYKDARFERRGDRLVMCIEGKCPERI